MRAGLVDGDRLEIAISISAMMATGMFTQKIARHVHCVR